MVSQKSLCIGSGLLLRLQTSDPQKSRALACPVFEISIETHLVHDVGLCTSRPPFASMRSNLTGLDVSFVELIALSATPAACNPLAGSTAQLVMNTMCYCRYPKDRAC